MGETRAYSSAKGHGRLLKSSARIALRNLEHLLQLAALFLFLPGIISTALLKAISPPPLHFNPLILQNLCYPYFMVGNSVLPQLDLFSSNSAWIREVSFGLRVVPKLTVIVFSQLMLGAVRNATMMAIRDFGMMAMVVTIGGAIYAAQKLARSSPHGEEVELELRRSRANEALTWCPYTVYVSTWAIIAIASWVLLFRSSQLELAARRAKWRLVEAMQLGCGRGLCFRNAGLVVGVPVFHPKGSLFLLHLLLRISAS